MKHFKVKAIDFVSMLRESVLFSEVEIDNIAIDCGKERTVSKIITVCAKLDIALDKAGINQLCQMEIDIV